MFPPGKPQTLNVVIQKFKGMYIGFLTIWARGGGGEFEGLQGFQEFVQGSKTGYPFCQTSYHPSTLDHTIHVPLEVRWTVFRV